MPPEDHPDVPVIIDSVKGDGLNMTRCTYFSIECDTPIPNWYLHTRSGGVPFFMLGLSGIICYPPGDHSTLLFGSASSFSELTEEVEQHEGLYIDIQSLWLPGTALQYASMPPARSSSAQDPYRSILLRIPYELFLEAFNYAVGRVTEDGFLQLGHRYAEAVRVSKEETESYRAWNEKLIAMARERYHSPETEGLRLAKRAKRDDLDLEPEM